LCFYGRRLSTVFVKKILDYFLSGFYFVYFWIGLLVFHVFEVLAYNIFGRTAHKVVVDYLNAWLLYGWFMTGTTMHFHNDLQLPTDRPIIFVANHQSMYDIILIIWYLRKYWPTFVSKKSLAKGIPGISYNLRKSGAALIDRDDSRQAIPEIAKLGELIEEKKISALIFPEGTRSKTGILKPFATGGMAILLKKSPSAVVVPLGIIGTAHFDPKNFFPVRSFSKLSLSVLSIIEPAGKTADEILKLVENDIRKHLNQD
jgi:1-acyl-sn-glycerol-3-phosphate acyltransferase